MENQKPAPTNFAPKPPASKSWLYLILVLVVGIGAAAYFFYISAQDSDQNNNNTISVNTKNVNTANGNVNSNLNTNANLNQNTNSNTNSVVSTTERKVTYQHLDHGFTIEVPGNWTDSVYTMGNREGEAMLSVYYTPTEGIDGLGGNISYYQNAGDLGTWVNGHKSKLAQADRTLSVVSAITINSQPAKRITATDTYISRNVNGQDATSTRTATYVYLQRDTKVYELYFEGSSESYQNNVKIIDAMINSFAFIDPLPTIDLANFSASQKILASKGYSVNVNWLTTPEALNISNDPVASSGGVVSRTYEKVGTITNGAYQGMSLINIYEIQEGPMGGPALVRAIFDNDSKAIVYLTHDNEIFQPEGIDIAKDTTTTIVDLQYPAEIAIPSSKVVLAEQDYNTTTKFSALTEATKQFTETKVGDVYIDLAGNCFFIKTADGLVKRYHVKPNFAKVETVNSEYPNDPSIFTPLITWSDDKPNTTEYQTRVLDNGCMGYSNCQDIRTETELGGLTALKETGRTSTGDSVYEYVDANTKELEDTYGLIFTPQGETKPTYEAFIAKHPIIFWKEPLGHWIAYRNTQYQASVECGKPVIYLYPEAETKVNVKVQPSGGLTITEPTYPENGWTVIAQPDGRLTTEDGSYYPYLFWEGIGLNYQIPSRGFVIARNDVNRFLKEKLALLGLNQIESADFIDFWQAKLEVKPYAFVTFIDQPVFDQLAPLTVTPTPDQVIRVFMDYQPLDAPISVQPLKITTPARRGFTVVEWGGALHR